MTLQYLWTLFADHPAHMLNALAMFFALAGSWLLLATRLRELRAGARLAADSELDDVDGEASLLDERTLRINRFFFHFAGACLALALVLSFYSTHL
ncbi:hypothetical protein PTT45_01915 [Pseudomonas sp. Gutcm_11s]|nr:hypothetical protein [Pseudomonas sp. Gutcm_11s]MDD0841501.1 hypothetical protein [Pseudomonas sp. Gutcm_11s]